MKEEKKLKFWPNEFAALIEVTIPAFIGPDKDKLWVGVLQKLTEVGYY